MLQGAVQLAKESAQFRELLLDDLQLRFLHFDLLLQALLRVHVLQSHIHHVVIEIVQLDLGVVLLDLQIIPSHVHGFHQLAE